MDHSFHRSQSGAVPLELSPAVKPLEYPKEFIGLYGIEAQSAIPQKESQGTAGTAHLLRSAPVAAGV